MHRLTFALALALVLSSAAACRDGDEKGPPIPASSDPAGADLVEGAIVAAVETRCGDPAPVGSQPAASAAPVPIATADGTQSCGVRLYKIKQVNYFPPPMTDELVMIAFSEKGNDIEHAAKLWQQRKLTVALPNVRVQRHMFRTRDYRVIDHEPVTEADKALKPSDPLPPRS
jgi:hypothetical protein